MANLWGVGRYSCPQRASAHLSQTGVLVSESGPCRWCTNTSASESSEIHPDESDGGIDSQILEPRRASWYHLVWLCAHYQPQAFTQWLLCLILWQAAELKYTFPEKAYFNLKTTTKEIITIPAPGCKVISLAVKNLEVPAFLGRCKGRLPTRQHIRKYTLNSARSTIAQPLTITFDLQYKPLFVLLSLHHD